MHNALAAADTELRDELPQKKEILQLHAFTLDTRDPTPIKQELEKPRLGGFELIKDGTDGNPARLLRFLESQLTVSIFDYHNWSDTIESSLRYLKTILSPLSFVDNPVTRFGLRYIDRFTFSGDINKADTRLLFRRGNPHLSTNCFTCGPFWHCHSGWFDSLNSREHRVLNQLEIGSAMIEKKLTVTVNHNMVWQMRIPRQTMQSIFGPSIDEGIFLREMLDQLHERNISTLKNILQLDMLKTIGMEES